MLSETIRNVLQADGTASLSNRELAVLVAQAIAPEEREQALLEALSSVISMQRSQVSRRLLRASAADEIRKPAEVNSPRPQRTPVMSGGQKFDSPRTALLQDQVLQYSITGEGGRRVVLEQAGIADLRFEITVSSKRGTTLVARAQIFDDMLHEMANLGLRRPRELPPESRAAYGRRIAELGSQAA